MMLTEELTFKNADKKQLSGKMDFPFVGKPLAYVLFAHCFTCSKNLKSVNNICDSLTRNGLAVLRFDFTGLGTSEGDFSETNFLSNISDLESAYKFMDQNYEAPQIVIGHSLGGTAVLYASGSFKKTGAIVTIGAPADPAYVKKLLGENITDMEEQGKAEVNIGGRPFLMKKQFLDDLEKQDSQQVIKDLDKSLLIIHSPQDEIVDIQNAAEIYDAAMHPKSFISIDRADHLLSDEEDASYIGTLICPWASRYIEKGRTNEIAPEGEVWTTISQQGFLTEVTAGGHHMLADEPKDSGGKDLGPSPYSYLLAALGTCTAMTLRMYADRKKIKLNEVRVKLTHDKVHNQDGNKTDSSKSKIDLIKRFIKIEGDLTEDQRKRLIEIADRCPVHKTLEGKPKIETKETIEI